MAYLSIPQFPGLGVQLWESEMDQRPCVQIDTVPGTDVHEKVRVFLNDAELNTDEIDEPEGGGEVQVWACDNCDFNRSDGDWLSHDPRDRCPCCGEREEWREGTARF